MWDKTKPRIGGFWRRNSNCCCPVHFITFEFSLWCVVLCGVKLKVKLHTTGGSRRKRRTKLLNVLNKVFCYNNYNIYLGYFPNGCVLFLHRSLGLHAIAFRKRECEFQKESISNYPQYAMRDASVKDLGVIQKFLIKAQIRHGE